MTTETMTRQQSQGIREQVEARLLAGETPQAIAEALGLDCYGDGDASHDVVALPGYWADDGNCPVEYPDAESGREAAEQYVADGDWGDESRTETDYHHLRYWRVALYLHEGEVCEAEDIDADSCRVTSEPPVPPCVDGTDDHDWQSPSWLGGCDENPGVWGHGGGVVCHEVCLRCGCGQETDSWAQDPQTGEQGLHSVTYHPDQYTDRVREEVERWHTCLADLEEAESVDEGEDRDGGEWTIYVGHATSPYQDWWAVVLVDAEGETVSDWTTCEDDVRGKALDLGDSLRDFAGLEEEEE